MTHARCPACQQIIDRERAAGRTYTARQEGSGCWHVAFMGKDTRRGTGASLHEAIQRAGMEE